MCMYVVCVCVVCVACVRCVDVYMCVCVREGVGGRACVPAAWHVGACMLVQSEAQFFF